MRKSGFMLTVGFLIGSTIGVFAQTPPAQVGYKYSDSVDCTAVLNPATLKVKDDTTYKMNYLALSNVDKGKVNTNGDYLGEITGVFNLDAGNVQKSIGEDVSYSDQFYMAERWLTPDQLKTFEDCLKIKNRFNGLEIHVRTWDNDSVTLSGDYNVQTPMGEGPPAVAFRSKISISGVPSEQQALNQFPVNLYSSNTINVRLTRDPKKRFIFTAATGDPIYIELPVLAEDPCVAVNKKTGSCTTYYLAMNGGQKPNPTSGDLVAAFPITSFPSATVIATGHVGWLGGGSTNPPQTGSAGSTDYSWTVNMGNPTWHPLSLSALSPDTGLIYPFGSALRIGKVDKMALEVTFKQNSCLLFPDRPPLHPQCWLSSLVLLKIDQSGQN
jgi:hypothetical protein